MSEKRKPVYVGDEFDYMNQIQRDYERELEEKLTPEDYRKNLRCEKIYPIKDQTIRTIGFVLTQEQSIRLGKALLKNATLNKHIKLTAWKDRRKSDNTHQITLEIID